MSEQEGKRPAAWTAAASKSRLLTLSIATAVVLVACGDDSSDERGVTTTAAETNSENTSSPTTSQPSDPGEDDDNQADTGLESGSQGGSATITIAGETVAFDSFTCYQGDAAVEAIGDEDATLFAFGETETSSGTSFVAVSASDGQFGLNSTIFYNPTREGDDARVGEVVWQRVGADAAIIDGDRIMGEGDFDRIVGGEHTGETDDGSFEATCG